MLRSRLYSIRYTCKLRSSNYLRCTRRLLHDNTTGTNITKINAVKLQNKERLDKIVNNVTSHYPSMSSIQMVQSDSSNTNVNKSINIDKFISAYVDRKLDKDLPDIGLMMNGRIETIRTAGKKMCFIDLKDTQDNQIVQLIINYNKLSNKENSPLTEKEFIDRISFLRKNDYIQVLGYPGVSENKKRTISLKCTSIPILLSPIQVPLPNSLSNDIKINKNRVLNYQVNGIQTMVLRSHIINSIRSFFLRKNFIEVETPILSNSANGANALPFVTKLNYNNQNLQLRIAPELWLKRLIIGGLNQIFEIGKVFRNESVDSTHNPEFTMLECYQRYLSMNDLIDLAQTLFKHIIKTMIPIIEGTNIQNDTIHELRRLLQENDWKFNQIEFLPTLSKEMNVHFDKVDLSDCTQLMSVIPLEVQKELFTSLELKSPQTQLSPQRILDKLCGKYIESNYCQGLLPTIILHHPVVMSPLAKINTENDLISQRFEVFIKGKEYINAYEEENCPQLQLKKFQKQHEFKENDKESLDIDYQYVETMKSGMPPTGGMGLGIDRLCMLLLEKNRIEQVLPFGSLDDVNIQ
ncbi:hypothetical protein C6P45_002180 [Maudiozyma exigua]|uniref:lysine--tRNA ligase n=1 Tax=Maudiozyma exigua TaxID=34358 RepID=A0A9P6VXA9_MAUEX|nr:hypothetical protein C6P45_002180 [Kazachstania exigua]